MRFLLQCVACGEDREMLLCLNRWRELRGEVHVCRACYEREADVMAQKSKKAKAKAKKVQQAKKAKR